MSVFDRRRAEALARDLDSAGAYDGSPAASADPAVALALRLRSASADLAGISAPRAEFRDALRTRLVAVATVRPVTAPEPGRAPGRGARRGAAVAAGALASVVAVSGVAVASSASLPGEPFYDVKRAAEGVQLALTGDGAAEGERHLQFAGIRLDELDGLVRGRGAGDDGPDWARVQTTLSDMDQATRTGSALLTEAWQSTGDRDLLTFLSGFTAEQAARLQALMPALAPAALEQAQSSLDLVDALAGTTRQLLQTSDSGGAPSAPGAPVAPSLEPSPSLTGEPGVAPSSPTPPPGAPSTTDPASPTGEPAGSDDSTAPSGGPAPSGVPTPLPTAPAAPLPTGATSSVTPLPSPSPVLDPLLSPVPLPGVPSPG